MPDWRPVPGHEGEYEVSDAAEVRRAGPARGAVVGRVLRPDIDAVAEQIRYVLSRGDRRSVVTLARLVATVFLGPPPGPGYVARNRDGNWRDCRPGNLVWTARKGMLGGKRASRLGPLLTAEIAACKTAGRRAADVAKEYGISLVRVYQIWRNEDKK